MVGNCYRCIQMRMRVEGVAIRTHLQMLYISLTCMTQFSISKAVEQEQAARGLAAVDVPVLSRRW